MALTPEQITAQNFRDFYRQILPYLNKGNGGTSDTPLGQVAFFDDLVAPYGWLVADGTVYNISDYPDLANHYERVHGSKNYWGGDGTTTFAVPNWQGEFLRASGTNSHTGQGDGGTVGEHQDATNFRLAQVATSSNPYIQFVEASDWSDVIKDNSDSLKRRIADSENPCHNIQISGTYSSSDITDGRNVLVSKTARPTNTSLLLCIKAIPSSEMNTYSLTERRVGTWIDGKPLYEKTIVTDKPAYTNGHCRVNIGASIDVVVKEHHEMISPDGVANVCNCLRSIDSGTVNHKVTVFTNTNQYHPNTIDYVSCSDMTSYTAQYTMYSTIQYTKTTDV